MLERYILPPSTVQVALGAHDISQLDTDPDVQLIDAEYVAVHPGFNPTSKTHDLAIIRLAEPAILNDKVQTISMARHSDDWGLSTMLTGWGNTAAGSGKSLTLRYAEMPIMPPVICNTMLDPDLDDTMLCAGDVPYDNPDARLTACHGDSGGPLAVDRGNGNWEQVGVVSWGQAYECGTFSVYSRITTQVDWIDWMLASGYRYLRCNNTGWDLSDSNRLTPEGTNGFGLEYDVTTLDDSCVLTHTNELNSWGTRNSDYRVILDDSPVSVPAEGNVTLEQTYPTHFQIHYPAPGRYKVSFPTPLTMSMQTKFTIQQVQ
jgi:hypothetical protein